uniref:Uncharacterized protein n=1 Tax=Ditylenchus dipsaci TaxID=166011 RepID=A0A915E5W1_9BILA
MSNSNYSASAHAFAAFAEYDEEELDEELLTIQSTSSQQLLHHLSANSNHNQPDAHFFKSHSKSTVNTPTNHSQPDANYFKNHSKPTVSTPTNLPLNFSASNQFNGRHAIWQYFEVGQQHTGAYYCRATPTCTSSYSWPPSTTVAGRHLRDRHLDVWNKVVEEEAMRKGMDVASHFGFSSQASQDSYRMARKRPLPSPPANLGEASCTVMAKMGKPVKMEEFAEYGYLLESKRPNNTLIKEIEEKRDQKHAFSAPPDAIASQSGWEQHEKTVELKRILERTKEQELSFKIKNQKTTEQLLDLQTELENLRSRNEQLEKKQRNFNNELQGVREQSEDVLKQKERLEKQCFEQNLTNSRRNTEIWKELETINDTNAIGDSTDTELANLRKAKREQEIKIVELEDELDECLQKKQILEQNITRLEMTVERARVDSQREAAVKETEISELRSQYQRRIRAFEDQINDLSDANNSLLKQNRLLENRTRQLDSQSQVSSVDLGSNHYKRELRRVTALYRDTQTLLAHERESAPNQSVVRQLKEQLEDVEAAKLSALKSRHSLENELADLRAQLDVAVAAKSAAEEKVLSVMREKNSATALVQEQDEQLQELLKKYKAQIQQSHVDAISLADQIEQIGNLERAKQRLQEQINELSSATEFGKLHTVEKHKMQLLELKLRDVQAKLDLETSHKLKLESIVVKLREEVESLQEQLQESRAVKDRELENTRKNRKETLLLQEQINELKKRETELIHKYKLEKSSSEKLVEDNQTTLGDLKLAMKRIDALQAALNADITAGSDIEEEDELDQMDENTSSMLYEEDMGPNKSLTNGIHADHKEYGS